MRVAGKTVMLPDPLINYANWVVNEKPIITPLSEFEFGEELTKHSSLEFDTQSNPNIIVALLFPGSPPKNYVLTLNGLIRNRLAMSWCCI